MDGADVLTEHVRGRAALRRECGPLCARWGRTAKRLATGGIVGDGSLASLLLTAEPSARRPRRRAAGEEGPPIPALVPSPHLALFRATSHGFVDYSEDVSSKDIISAVQEGYDSAELAKRYTTATMGPAQGKLETLKTVAVLAEATGRTMAETGTTVWRPPYVPLSLGALAGRDHEPVRYSPMQPWHEAHGATPLVAGQWFCPEHYGDPEAEVRNVREKVGIIDVTPLGKLDLRGRMSQAPEPAVREQVVEARHRLRPLRGHVRRGRRCLGRRGDGSPGQDHYLMSTTSSGAATVWEWLESWLQCNHPGWQVHVTQVTTAYASINVAGPASAICSPV